ncbi:MAG: 2Fe-2S iron-sulfur cluster-binding protein, partial [Myxococcota bacterium]
GDNIISVAHEAGIDVPFYCWHPRLSVAANCRMCLVEVEKMNKLVPACEVRCREGMVVNTRSERVLEAREAVMEFLLVNHPIDCPICDQAGECKLQDYYMEHDRSGTRFEHTKVVKRKAVPLGPEVMLDEERCINCTRCVRFMDEVAENPQLGQFDRGDRAVIGTFPGRPLDDPYSLNTVEICPVGALTSRDFRFKVRQWLLKTTDTLCSGCARGCAVHADHYQNELQRYRARENPHVNQSWLCDAGRLSYKRVHDPETQVTVPHARAPDGRMVPISWEQAKEQIQALLGPFVGDTDAHLGLALSSQLTTEGLTAFIELAEHVLPVDTYAILGRPPWAADHLLKVSDRNPNRAGAELVLEAYSIYDDGAAGLRKALAAGNVKTLLMAGTEHPDPEAWVSALEGVDIIALATNWDETCTAAQLVLPLASFAEQEGTFVNHAGRMQRLRPALKPIRGRKTDVGMATFVAEALGEASEWSLRSWREAFTRLATRTNLLDGVDPDALGSYGRVLEVPTEAPEPTPAEVPAATPA